MDAVELECYTDFEVISGSVYYPAELRLIRVFNSRESNYQSEFVHFVETPDKYRAKIDGVTQNVYVRKSAIQFAAISDGNVRRGLGAALDRKFYPFVIKSPVHVSLRLPTYTLTGTIHRCQGQTVEGVLNEACRFLPMTEVTITGENRLFGSRPFVAVNRELIIWSTEEGHLSETYG